MKEKLSRGEAVAMVGMRYGAPGLVERIGALGFDAAFIDCEKRSFTMERIEDMCRAARVAGIPAIVRPWANEAGLISRLLDIGADGVMIASIDNADAARALVADVRYARYADHESKIIIGMIESPEAVDHLAEMLTVDGIDVWFIGGNDLAQRMGFPGAASRPEVQAVIDNAIRLIVDSNHVCGALVDYDTVQLRLQQGVRFLLLNVDTLLAGGTTQFNRVLDA
ncbi:HpcH/HpaI aldolase/citrate lyase family protein [Bordetella sp. BOR01]|uniref:HpcH/HpaI aldolase family protein n=1 Tax=Bordetella sp. BOR01 TaxID=2854779 RepID=UPI001C4516FE|nr:aldolase/citrate lyase family protein [Bordetella sp. BOR01]MBV7483681.1 hypothetical protein [Bordetella sp. BOR01]